MNDVPVWVTDLGLDANPQGRTIVPVSFTSHLTSITPGQSQVLSTSGLANGYRTPYVVDEIHMQAYMTTAAAEASLLQPSAAVKFKFRTGSYDFSINAIPMILHQPAYVQDAFGAGGSSSGQGGVLRSAFTGTTYIIGDEARWALPKPLWMGPGDVIQCTVERDSTWASTGNDPFIVDVTYVGRALPPGTKGPRVRHVPWIAHYIHDFSDAFSQTTTQFRNPITRPLTIQRFIGRPLSKAAAGVFRTTQYAGLPRYSFALGLDIYAKIFMEDSAGYKITNGFVPIGNVFDTMRGAWTFSRDLGPREQFNIQFRTLGTAVDQTNTTYGVSMIGYREETGL